MKPFPLSKDDWYEQRDNRTNQIAPTYDYRDFSVGVAVDRQVENSYSIQCMTLLACNMLARWCRRVSIDVSSCKHVLPHTRGSDFAQDTLQLMNGIDPFGQFALEAVDVNEFDGVLVIGNASNSSSSRIVNIHGDGWIAGCSYGEMREWDYSSDQNPVGPGMASCMGVSELFQQAVLRRTHKPYSKWHNLYDFTETDQPPNKMENRSFCTDLDLGTVLQIGCGAVGSSLDYLISLTPWKGHFYLIDPDVIDYSNCNRSLPFIANDGAEKKHKVEVCSEYLKTRSRATDIFDDFYYDFTGTQEFENSNPDLLLSLANEQKIWSTIQDNFPPLTFHATTTLNWGINFGRHIPRREWCILCRFSNNMKSNVRFPCETGELPNTGKEKTLGTLPFLSPAAAILMMADMAKLDNDQFPINPNFIEMSFQRPFPKLLAQKSPVSKCTCISQPISLYESLRSKSKFWKYTIR